MASNFDFLLSKKEYTLFAEACVEAERVLSASPAMSAIGSRKALELGVKWVYAADNTMRLPYRAALGALIHDPDFKFAVDNQTWRKLELIQKLGNMAVHTERKISRNDAVLSLSALFEFVLWIDYCYGTDYQSRKFDEALISGDKPVIDLAKYRQKELELEEKNAQLSRQKKELEELRSKLGLHYSATTIKLNKDTRTFIAKEPSEFETRKKYIDVDLKLMGWTLDDDARVEVPVADLGGVKGKRGKVDYVLYGTDGYPLAVVEAKKTTKDPVIGKKQAQQYADCLHLEYGCCPVIFYTNGFETWFWDYGEAPPRPVSSIFGRTDLEKIVQRRAQKKPLNTIPIDDKITDRPYQKEAIRAVCDKLEDGHRKHLLVMATGTGKTRTAASFVDVLSRGNHATNVLFLADRKALVKQAKGDFKIYLPSMSLCNLLDNKDDKTARIVFSTYPTILNAIDSAKTKDGTPLFSPAYFDLIIIDEAHRSIFKKYKAIFDYFDAALLGLTATPKREVDRNTYDFFELEKDVPTFAYGYNRAKDVERVLVPYHNIEVKTLFQENGITYKDLSEADQERYEEDFAEDDGSIEEYKPPEELNKIIFNQKTVDMVLQDLMTKGVRIKGGDCIGKTIIFAQNKDHAKYIVQRFDKLYPQYKGTFAERVTCEDSRAQDIIDSFKIPDNEPFITVSVDMMDTGIDVREIVNLVFFKKVRSITKFWQMIGRGTRICPELSCIDGIDGSYDGKRRFYIFDYLSNFDFFRQKKFGIEGREVKSLTELIFSRKVQLIHILQQSEYMSDQYQEYRNELINDVRLQICDLNENLVAVRLQRKYVEKFQRESSYECLTEQDQYDLNTYLAPLVYMDEKDEYAKRFDSMIYGVMIAIAEGNSITRSQKDVVAMCSDLLAKTTISQVKNKVELLKQVKDSRFWSQCGIVDLERIRIELRELIKFLFEDGDKKKKIYTNLTDVVLSRREGDALEQETEFEDYKIKVNRYIEEHKDHLAIYKLRNNLPLTQTDYVNLEEILTQELGNHEDYQREFGNTPFGILVRKIAKLERDVAMEVFSSFINEQNLNQEQIVFVNKVIDYISQNGYIDNLSVLTKPPFDKPRKFLELFDGSGQKTIVTLITNINNNAVL